MPCHCGWNPLSWWGRWHSGVAQGDKSKKIPLHCVTVPATVKRHICLFLADTQIGLGFITIANLMGGVGAQSKGPLFWILEALGDEIRAPVLLPQPMSGTWSLTSLETPLATSRRCWWYCSRWVCVQSEARFCSSPRVIQRHL